MAGMPFHATSVMKCLTEYYCYIIKKVPSDTSSVFPLSLPVAYSFRTPNNALWDQFFPVVYYEQIGLLFLLIGYCFDLIDK